MEVENSNDYDTDSENQGTLNMTKKNFYMLTTAMPLNDVKISTFCREQVQIPIVLKVTKMIICRTIEEVDRVVLREAHSHHNS